MSDEAAADDVAAGPPPAAKSSSTTTAFGPNVWLVDDMYEQYTRDPSSVAESWRDFFDGYRPDGVAASANGAAPAEPLRGAARLIAATMEASLAVPTATSTRVVPARLLEVNRTILNRYLGRTGGGKVSVTHLIGWAVVKAVAAVPAMKASFRDDGDGGGPSVVRPDHIGLGIAVDVEKKGGGHSVIVPNIRAADTLDFRAFRAAYEDAVRKVRTQRVMPDDLDGVTMTLTNPGTLGTVMSVPRLVAGQSVIVGVGALGYPAEFAGSDPRALADLGVSKTVALTSTYDHRVIQGAESGLFLGRVHELLLGGDGFYDDVFQSMGVPYEPVRWHADSNPHESGERGLEKQVHVQSLINMYRVRGHLIADLDPLHWKEPHTHPELDPATYGLTIWDLEREYFTDGLAGRDVMTLGDILGVLRDAYCRRIGVEYMHIQEPDQKRWIQDHVEGVDTTLSTAEQLHVLDRLNAAEAFERFLHTKYVGHKRFGLEGAESLIPLVDELLDQAAVAGSKEAVLGMAHRGRLNVLANIVGKSLGRIFREFEGDIDPRTTQGSGDVKYHLGADGTFVGRSGRELPVTLASNPSHVEAVDPVVEGMVRARQDLVDQPGDYSVVPIVLHGDAAFAGQGVVAETLNLSALRGYRVGGTVHVVINNQVGFTTSPAEGRSSVYPTDVAKMVQAPIFHVNGDDPEACVRVARLAYGFRQAFHKDVVIDLVCYRRHGHNETDDPSITHPLVYQHIDGQRSVRKLYTETLVRRGDITVPEAEKALEDFLAKMQSAFAETHQSRPPEPAPPEADAGPVEPAADVETGVARAALDRIVDAVHHPPEGFTPHPKLVKLVDARLALYAEGLVDWSLAETLALGSLLVEGTDVRLAGQDSRRGTFSQRHGVLLDYERGVEWGPLWGLGQGQGKLWVFDSSLSEYAALGFEYGYSVVHKDALVMWEAQFGDFANAAQVVIDQFVAAAEDKWGQTSGLVLLLPHGYEGQGPEHSSARVERFLTLCANDNLDVVNPTTASQYFHLLRRQVRRGLRRPLVLLTPKSLLRARVSRSAVDELVAGSFQPVLGDSGSHVEPAAVRRVVLASGKVAYDVMAARDEAGAPVPVLRVEQLYPWPAARLAELLAPYEGATEVMWVQEEPENMGPGPWVHERLHQMLGTRYELLHVARRASASPASGSQTVHQHEQQELMEKVLSG